MIMCIVAKIVVRFSVGAMIVFDDTGVVDSIILFDDVKSLFT